MPTCVTVLAGGALAAHLPDVSALIGAGSLLYLCLYLLSGPLSSLSSHAASGDVVTATLLCGLWWHLSHSLVVMATPAALLARFYGGVAAWALAYACLLLSERLWPTTLEAEFRWAAARQQGRQWGGPIAEGEARKCSTAAEAGAGWPRMWWLRRRAEAELVPRGVGLAVIRSVLAVAPALTVLACMG